MFRKKTAIIGFMVAALLVGAVMVLDVNSVSATNYPYNYWSPAKPGTTTTTPSPTYLPTAGNNTPAMSGTNTLSKTYIDPKTGQVVWRTNTGTNTGTGTGGTYPWYQPNPNPNPAPNTGFPMPNPWNAKPLTPGGTPWYTPNTGNTPGKTSTGYSVADWMKWQNGGANPNANTNPQWTPWNGNPGANLNFGNVGITSPNGTIQGAPPAKEYSFNIIYDNQGRPYYSPYAIPGNVIQSYLQTPQFQPNTSYAQPQAGGYFAWLPTAPNANPVGYNMGGMYGFPQPQPYFQPTQPFYQPAQPFPGFNYTWPPR